MSKNPQKLKNEIITLDGVDALLDENPSLAPIGPTDFELKDIALFRRPSRSSSRSSKIPFTFRYTLT